MSSLAERIANAFGGAKRQGKGWMCKCPCHDDKQASLGVIDSDNGDDVIFNCLAGCSWEDIKRSAKVQGLISVKEYKPRDLASGPIHYIYVDEQGKPIARKVRYPGKKFAIERLDNVQWVKGLNGLVVPLYNLPNVIKTETVYLCEGEKDADNLIKLGLCATTNIAGASHWRHDYNRYFGDKSVVICEDNDQAGRDRTKKLTEALNKVAKELLVFRPPAVKEAGDVSDWLQDGGKAEDIIQLSVAVNENTPLEIGEGVENLTEPKRKGKQKPTPATQQDYFKLIENYLEKPKRCIFSEKLMTFEKHSKLWNPASNHLERLKAEALRLNEACAIKYNKDDVKPHFFAYESLQKPVLLVDIPEWDGTDRISEMAYAVKIRSSSGVTTAAFSELLKEWCAMVFARLDNPMKQNRCLILQGPQGAGKDTWISHLVDGLGQFSVPLSVMREDKDTYINLSRGLIMKVSEYDKTSQTQTSTIKDLITSPSTNLREAYGHDAKVRINRCSFISSANVENLLRDYTGSRRFLIFEVEHIDYLFEGWTESQTRDWQMQCLAEMKELYKTHYKASVESWRQMNEYLNSRTPQDPAESFLADFLAEVKKDSAFSLKWDNQRRIAVTDSDVQEMIQKVAARTGIKLAWAKQLLYQKIGKQAKIGQTRVRVYQIPQIPQVEYNASDDIL